jgi:hypothetical protein
MRFLAVSYQWILLPIGSQPNAFAQTFQVGEMPHP